MPREQVLQHIILGLTAITGAILLVPAHICKHSPLLGVAVWLLISPAVVCVVCLVTIPAIILASALVFAGLTLIPLWFVASSIWMVIRDCWKWRFGWITPDYMLSSVPKPNRHPSGVGNDDATIVHPEAVFDYRSPVTSQSLSYSSCRGRSAMITRTNMDGTHREIRGVNTTTASSNDMEDERVRPSPLTSRQSSFYSRSRRQSLHSLASSRSQSPLSDWPLMEKPRHSFIRSPEEVDRLVYRSRRHSAGSTTSDPQGTPTHARSRTQSIQSISDLPETPTPLSRQSSFGQASAELSRTSLASFRAQNFASGSNPGIRSSHSQIALPPVSATGTCRLTSASTTSLASVPESTELRKMNDEDSGDADDKAIRMK